MKRLKEILLSLILVSLLASCSKGEKKIISKYDDGTPFVVQYFKTIKGAKTKVYEEHYYPNGKKRLQGAFKNDKKSGKWVFFFEDGSSFAQADFTKSINGDHWQFRFSKDSVLVNKNDAITSIAFSNEQTPVSVKVKRGKGEIFYRFFNSFKIMMRVPLKGNIPNGEAMSWFENGNINSILYYKDGMQDSTYTVYADNGQKIQFGHYNQGIRVGKWEYYSSNGSPLGIEVYDVDGTLLVPREDPNIKVFRHGKK